MPEVILIRHAEVALDWKLRCYGAMDIPLSAAGVVQSQQLADEFATKSPPIRIFHSGLQRTKCLASMLGEHFPTVPIIESTALRERDYGWWQGKSWDEVYASDPNFHDVIHQPKTYRPAGGETTYEMQQRVVAWFESLWLDPFCIPDDPTDMGSGPVIAISHSGPMAALAGHCLELPATEWGPWMVKHLEALHFHKQPDSLKVDFSQPLIGTVSAKTGSGEHHE